MSFPSTKHALVNRCSKFWRGPQIPGRQRKISPSGRCDWATARPKTFSCFFLPTQNGFYRFSSTTYCSSVYGRDYFAQMTTKVELHAEEPIFPNQFFPVLPAPCRGAPFGSRKTLCPRPTHPRLHGPTHLWATASSAVIVRTDGRTEGPPALVHLHCHLLCFFHGRQCSDDAGNDRGGRRQCARARQWRLFDFDVWRCPSLPHKHEGEPSRAPVR